MPAYPESAREEKVCGVVVLELVIDSGGSLGEIKTLESPDPRLTEAAIEAIRQWQFEPARRAGGTALSVYFVLSTNFSLR
jgi:protein TonB